MIPTATAAQRDSGRVTPRSRTGRNPGRRRRHSLGNGLTTTDSPAAARRRLRFALRAAREAAELTQAEVAERLEWSVSKVNRIENGEVTISATDLRALMALLGVTDRETVERLTSWARTARSRGWWDEPEYRAHLTPAMRQLIQYEAEATAIRCYQPTIVPGALQTPEYAQEILNFWTDIPNETRAVRHAVRAERRRRIFQGTERPVYLLLLDESVIHRQVGGPAVMAGQLRSLLAMIRNNDLIVRIVPMVHGAMIGQGGNFTIIDLIGEQESSVLYQELLHEDHIRDERETVNLYRSLFERMWEVALTPEASTAFIEGHAATMDPSIFRNHPGT
jgi:transcriptional regulator with XRE-family HTH domain